MVRIRGVIPKERLKVELELTDGTHAEVDLDTLLVGPVFEPLRRDRALFESVTVDETLGTLVWPNGADLCPDVLIMRARGQSVEDFLGRAVATV
jgi:hypothetical protein